jgi:T4 RnlA family RNA ligase
MLKVLEKYYNDGLVYKQVHPTLPLTIWNYSEKVQYESLWDDITLQTRGLVTDDKGNVVARPFKKFFNIEEGKHTPTSEFDVYAKMDGSLGILFNYEGEWVMATRGSFTSDQAIKGMEMLSKYDYNRLNKGYTYLFEIIFANNRIVCRYSFEDVVLLGVIETSTGYEVNIYDGENDVRLRNLINNLGFQVVKKYDGIKDYSVLKGMIRDDEEGYVVRFSNGDRMKVKGEEYLRLHKIMTNVSTTAIWEVLSSGGNMDDLLKDVPDEFYKKIKEYVKQLRYQYWSVQEHAGKYFDNLYESYDRELPEKAKYAEWVKQFDKHLHPILFRMYDNKDYSSYIWKLIKPDFKKL